MWAPVTPETQRELAPICVIGAGPAGLSALKALKEAGFAPIAFEMGTEVGGLWAINNQNGRGGAYETLHINTSRKAMEFSDFPMRGDVGDFPDHRYMAEYFAAYAKEFGLLSHIHFNKEVVKCSPTPDGYLISVLDRKTGKKDERVTPALVVASGHHWSPHYPQKESFESFGGTVLHAAEYRSPKSPHDFKGERVLVVGIGNSAVDIACELSRDENAKSVSVAARRGAWVLPKYILGKPLDQGRLIPTWLPGKLRRKIVTKCFELLYGTMPSRGLPEPDHLIGEAHPTVSSEFPERVSGGHIQMRKGFVNASGKTVTFADGTRADFDTVLFCTGYNVEFPFFSPEHISAPDNYLPLYHRTFHFEHRRVFFVGLAQTIGAVMPFAETQSRLIAAHLRGDYNLPDVLQMKEVVAREEREMKARFVESRRHTMQVIPEEFQKKVARDLRQGRARATNRAGISFPELRIP